MVSSIRAKKKMKRILIVLPNTSHMLLQLQSGLLTALEAYSQTYGFFPYQYCIFTLEDDFRNGSFELSQRLSTESYDIIFTVGTKCTQIVKNLAMKIRIATPIVFGGVLEPEQIFLNMGSLPLVTGVKALAPSYDRQLEILLMLGHPIKKVLILQNRTITVGSEVYAGQRIVSLLAKHGIDGQEVIVDDMSALQPIINPYLPGTDLIIMLRRNIFMSHFHSIVGLSFEREIPLYSCDLSSVHRGATLAFGDLDYKIGVEIVKKGLPLLVEGGSVRDLSVSVMPWEEKVIINAALAKRHNFNINRQAAESIQGVNFL